MPKGEQSTALSLEEGDGFPRHLWLDGGAEVVFKSFVGSLRYLLAPKDPCHQIASLFPPFETNFRWASLSMMILFYSFRSTARAVRLLMNRQSQIKEAMG